MRRCLPFLLPVVLALALPSLAAASLALNEIMADPDSDWDGDGEYDYKDDEWVELYNCGPEAIDLEPYRLSDDEGLWTYGFESGATLAPGEALVIYGSQSVLWQQDHAQPQYGFKMSNDGDTVILWEFTADDTLLVDTHTFNTYEAEDDRSTGRNPDGIGAWEIFDALNPYSGSTPPYGNDLGPTPGYPNFGDPPVAAGQTTWGRMKGLFR